MMQSRLVILALLVCVASLSHVGGVFVASDFYGVYTPLNSYDLTINPLNFTSGVAGRASYTNYQLSQIPFQTTVDSSRHIAYFPLESVFETRYGVLGLQRSNSSNSLYPVFNLTLELNFCLLAAQYDPVTNQLFLLTNPVKSLAFIFGSVALNSSKPSFKQLLVFYSNTTLPVTYFGLTLPVAFDPSSRLFGFSSSPPSPSPVSFTTINVDTLSITIHLLRLQFVFMSLALDPSTPHTAYGNIYLNTTYTVAFGRIDLVTAESEILDYGKKNSPTYASGCAWIDETYYYALYSPPQVNSEELVMIEKTSGKIKNTAIVNSFDYSDAPTPISFFVLD